MQLNLLVYKINLFLYFLWYLQIMIVFILFTQLSIHIYDLDLYSYTEIDSFLHQVYIGTTPLILME